MSTVLSELSTASIAATADESDPSGKRCEWIDHLRLVAAFAVVWIHVAAPTLGDTVAGGGLYWWIGNVTNAAMRWCVPAFVMISGMLLIPRAGEGNEWAFYKRRGSRVLIPTLFWTGFYLVWGGLHADQFSLRRAIVLLVFGRAYYHLWFLYTLLGLYLAAPFLAAFVARVRRRTVVLAVIMGFSLASCQAMLDATRGVWYPVFLSWVGFVPYFLAGHLLGDRRFIRVTRPFLLGAVGISIVLAGLLMGLFWPVFSVRAVALSCNSFNPLIIIMSIAVFLLFRDWHGVSSSRGSRLVASVAPFMLGVYLVHPLCIELLGYLGITGTAVPGSVGIPLCSALVFLLSLGVCLGLMVLPGGRRLVM